MDEIDALCNAVPEARVIVTESPFARDLLVREDGTFRFPNLYLDTTRVSLAGLPEDLAAKHILFGTGAPFKGITPALLRLETADLSAEARCRIEGDTARSLLGLG
jgi:predicted TIM-barrel fold metal-dependent hydrolase